MRRYHETFRLWEYLLFTLVTLTVLCLCVCVGSVRIPLADTLSYFAARLTGSEPPAGLVSSILPIRMPRVLCVALTGAALSLAGAAMQGLLKNPLADGSTLGVSSGASLGAVIAIAFGVTLPGLPFAGTMGMAIVFAFLSLLIILALSYKLDRSLSTNTIILIGVIFSMFVSSIMSIIITFAADKVQRITFWTMGSLSGSTYQNAAVLAGALLVCGTVIVLHAPILNPFAVAEDNARRGCEAGEACAARDGFGAHRCVRVRRRDDWLCRPRHAAYGAHAGRPESQAAAPRVDVRRGGLSDAG